MAKKKISLSKNQRNELKGFEDVLDLITDEDTVIVKKERSQAEDYEIYNFLEKEIQRLEKIDQFFRHQIEILEKKPSIDTYLDQDKVFLDEAKKNFIDQMKNPKSQFLNNMDKLFYSIFSL